MIDGIVGAPVFVDDGKGLSLIHIFLLERVRGEYVRSGGALATLFADSIERLDEAEALLADAFRLQDKKPQPTKTIYKTIC